MARDRQETLVPQTLQQDAPVPAPAPLPTYFHIGLTAACPYDSLTVGGVTFHKFTEDVAEKPNSAGETIRTQRQGQIVPLDEEAAKRVKRLSTQRVIRMNGARRTKWAIEDPRYRRDASDTPVGKFMYMVAVQTPDENPPPPTLS